MAGYFKTMSDGTPVNKEKVKAIQAAMGILSDGLLGEHTLDRIYRAYAQPQDAYSDFFYNATVITGRPENVSIGLKMRLKHNYVSGTFQWEGKTISPLVVDGELINGNSAHSWFNKPDTVIYYDGEIKVKQTTYFDEPCQWAIGGVGLHDYDPVAEGYGEYYDSKGVPRGKYADVLRYCNHTAVGIYPDGYMILVKAKGNGEQIRSLMIDKLKCKYAALLDGGDTIPGIDCEVEQFNIYYVQNNIIGFGR